MRDAFLRLDHATSLSPRLVKVEELFHPSAYETFKLRFTSLPRLGRRFGEVGPVDFSGHRSRGSIQGFDESCFASRAIAERADCADRDASGRDRGFESAYR